MLDVCTLPPAVLVHQRPCLSYSFSASVICGGGRWRPGQRVCFAFSLCGRGEFGGWRGGSENSACDFVVCVCRASASLNKQRLGWTLFYPVFAVELGRGRERGKAT